MCEKGYTLFFSHTHTHIHTIESRGPTSLQGLLPVLSVFFPKGYFYNFFEELMCDKKSVHSLNENEYLPQNGNGL